MMESFAIEGEEEERNMRRSNNGFSGPGFKCFLNRIQDYEEARESARKVCEKKGLPEFCKCKHHDTTIIDSLSMIMSCPYISRWSVGPGSELLMCSTGKHGTNTWAR